MFLEEVNVSPDVEEGQSKGEGQRGRGFRRRKREIDEKVSRFILEEPVDDVKDRRLLEQQSRVKRLLVFHLKPLVLFPSPFLPCD